MNQADAWGNTILKSPSFFGLDFYKNKINMCSYYVHVVSLNWQ